jgi:hypothetical protein
MYRHNTTCCSNKETIKCCPSSINKVTYDELIELINNNELFTGKIYLILDYQYMYTTSINDASVNVYGPVEPLYVKADSANTLSSVATSYYYPGDLIQYDVNGDYKGTILLRN